MNGSSSNSVDAIDTTSNALVVPSQKHNKANKSLVQMGPDDTQIHEQTKWWFWQSTINSGTFAILFGESIRRKCHKKLGYKTIKEYALKEFGLKGAACKKACTAANAIWAKFPDLCANVMARLQSGPDQQNPLPFVPNETTLALLPAAAKRVVKVDPTGEADLLAKVRSGEFTSDDVNNVGRQPTANAGTNITEADLSKVIKRMAEVEDVIRNQNPEDIDEKTIMLIQQRFESLTDAITIFMESSEEDVSQSGQAVQQ